MKRKILSIALVFALVLTTACSEKDNGKDKTGKKSKSKVTVAELDKSEILTDSTSNLEAVSYSRGLDDNGYWKGIDAASLFTMFDYGNMEMPESLNNVAEDEIESYVNSVVMSGNLPDEIAENKITDRAIEDGDRVNIDYNGSIDGVEFTGGNSRMFGDDGQFVTAGSAEFIDDFLTQIIGHKPGEVFDVTVSFPEEYPSSPDLAGKEAVFEVEVHYIADNEKLTEFARNALRGSAIRNYIMDYITNNVEVKIPEQMKLRMEKNMLEQVKDESIKNSVTMEEYMASNYNVQDMNGMVKEMTPHIEKNAKQIIVTQAIALELGFIPSDADIKSLLLIGEDDTELYNNYVEQYELNYLKQAALMDMVFNHIIENAKFVEDAAVNDDKAVTTE